MPKLLDSIREPKDLKGLSLPELSQVANEVRELIVDAVSETGGHLASNLGAADLTVALHYTFDFSADRLIWDVGHQCYPHKVLTGRKDRMMTIRQHGGIAGFPDPKESIYDPFLTSHAGTSISAGLGLAAGDAILHRQRRIVCVIGDGSLSSGVAMEALNQAGDLKRNILIILNHNQMCISRNVGALAHYLDQVRTAALYQELKREVGHFLGRFPTFGKDVETTLSRIKDAVRHGLLPAGTIFEALGLKYYGPVDGHDMKALVDALALVRDLQGPVLLHVVTEKGRGYPYSSKDPVKYHQMNPFDKENGEVLRQEKGTSYSRVFGRALVAMAEKDPRIVTITAAMAEGTGLMPFGERFPGRMFDVGIAEQHAVAFAGGLATTGLRPVVAIYSTFLQRSYDQIFQEVCLQGLPVVFAVDRAGITGGDGATAQGNFDIAYLRSLPDMTVLAPSNGPELASMLQFAVDFSRPIALRYPRDIAPEARSSDSPAPIELGKAEPLREGDAVALFALGAMVDVALAAADLLASQGVSCAVINARFAKPVDRATILHWLSRVPLLVTLEDHGLDGGFGSAVLEAAEGHAEGARRIRRIGIPDRFIEHGPRGLLLGKLGMDAQGVAGSILRFIPGHS